MNEKTSRSGPEDKQRQQQQRQGHTQRDRGPGEETGSLQPDDGAGASEGADDDTRRIHHTHADDAPSPPVHSTQRLARVPSPSAAVLIREWCCERWSFYAFCENYSDGACKRIPDEPS